MPSNMILRALRGTIEEDLVNSTPKCTKLELKIFLRRAKRKTCRKQINQTWKRIQVYKTALDAVIML
jgi:hypothetical protein